MIESTSADLCLMTCASSRVGEQRKNFGFRSRMAQIALQRKSTINVGACYSAFTHLATMHRQRSGKGNDQPSAYETFDSLVLYIQSELKSARALPMKLLTDKYNNCKRHQLGRPSHSALVSNFHAEKEDNELLGDQQLTCMVSGMGIQAHSSRSNHLSVSSANGPMAGNTQSLPNSHTSNAPGPAPTIPVQPVAADFLPASTSTAHPSVRQENGPNARSYDGPTARNYDRLTARSYDRPAAISTGLVPANVVLPTHFGFKGSATPPRQVNTSGSVSSLGTTSASSTDVSACTALTITSGARQPVAAAVSSTAPSQPRSQQVLADL
ncbi:uncharacterized protein LOC135830467 [Sycon ciliatum]|uniref:uncharacterized protein LOC135830467 n=1 Tax=Sycon ciliatum TaxID=27933 RepID=UPI0031F71466